MLEYCDCLAIRLPDIYRMADSYLEYRKVLFRSTWMLFRLLMKGIFYLYVLWPFDKKLISYLVTRIRTRNYTVDIRVLNLAGEKVTGYIKDFWMLWLVDDDLYSLLSLYQKLLVPCAIKTQVLHIFVSWQIGPSGQWLKFIFSEKTTKFDEIFTVDCFCRCQIHGEDFVNLCGLLRKH
jgi:hypothetical protein